MTKGDNGEDDQHQRPHAPRAGKSEGEPCPDCGQPLCGLPVVKEHEFERAKAIAQLAWDFAYTLDSTNRSLGVLLMAAALLTKRAGLELGVSTARDALGGLAVIFMDQARGMILERRERAAVANRKAN